MKKVAIIGAGISGLFVANLFREIPDYQVTIYEKNSSIIIFQKAENANQLAQVELTQIKYKNILGELSKQYNKINKILDNKQYEAHSKSLKSKIEKANIKIKEIENTLEKIKDKKIKNKEKVITNKNIKKLKLEENVKQYEEELKILEEKNILKDPSYGYIDANICYLLEKRYLHPTSKQRRHQDGISETG